MDSLSFTATIGSMGKAQGVTANPALFSGLNGKANVTVALSSTGTGGGKAVTAYAPGLYTITASGTLTIDLTSFSSLLNESSASIGKARFVLISHDTTSTASAITVGNAASNPWAFAGMSAATTTFSLKPKEFICFGSQSTAGFATSGSSKNLKIVNADGSNSAIVKIVLVGDA